ncbi:alpha/beta hydrolase [Microbacterium ulmi]|uniref:Alpha/beta hydrolase n=1 Tax=Microbacterium ulmi TaxID=179095 RepID=A0A7Y2Q126_9MICO|nr:alpha/beta hydrolase [Microbacterium ulmi]NII69622.1 acetyl esterase/lipase [Microbacterium ulmi]NNH03490.1 alpha/beta hydrolase [Microbacterium ulmi]
MTTDPNRRHWELVARSPDATDWGELAREPAQLRTERVERPAGAWLRPPRPVSDAALLCIHGGGFVSGSVATHRRMFGHLADASRLPAFAVEYGLVPQHVHPDQLETVVAAHRWLVGQGFARIAVLGDSCGALLAIWLAQRMRGIGFAPPIALVLLSAWVDLEADGGSYDSAPDPFFTRDIVRSLAAAYLAGADPRDPRIAVLRADLSGLPPVLLQVGGDEALRDDSIRLAERLRVYDVPVRLEEFEGQLHTFQMAAGRSAAADDAIGRAGRWLRSILGS